jgi:hypothetical protein
VLNLTYTPAAIGSGTLTLEYVFLDAAGSPQTIGSMSLPYVATVHNNVVATASPSGEIDAVVGAGTPPVTVSFTTDDGNPASALTLSLATLPPGWSSTATNFSCDSISTGNGCQLSLSYAPLAADQGTVTLNYSYLDNSLTAKQGSLNIAYAATPQNNVEPTVAPAAPISAVAGVDTVPVSITFDTDDGKPATNFSITSGLTSLPPGWSSTGTNLSCGTVSTGTSCQLTLTYAPTAPTPPGLPPLTLGFSYVDDAGVPQTGTVTLDYSAT